MTRLWVALDGDDEPTLWREGEREHLPEPVLRRCDLGAKSRHLWAEIVERLGCDPTAEAIREARAETEALRERVRALADRADARANAERRLVTTIALRAAIADGDYSRVIPPESV